MTLQQLKYAITVAQTGTITEAAEKLYISQPSLTNAIHELEKEMNIEIFTRTNKGIIVSKDGEDFLGYARQVLEQAAVLEDKYKGGGGGKKKFCISTQHYSFAVNAFVDLIKKYGQDEYDFSIRETQWVQANALRAWDTKTPFKELVLQDENIMQYVTKEELDEIFDYSYHTKNVDYIFKRCGLL